MIQEPSLTAYQRLAQRLDALPNGFPPAAGGEELRLLAKLFTPEEAELAAQLRMTLETPDQIAGRAGGDPGALRKELKRMARRGLITAGQAEGGLGFGLLPFVVGIYEMQFASMDEELAGLFEAYFLAAFGQVLEVKPVVHRVIPVYESVKVGLEVRPFESAAEIVAGCKSWGVIDCICRKQQMLLGKGCQHPLDVCMVLSGTAGAFDQATSVRALTQEEALATLRRAAEAGLVHSVSNHQKGVWYICNCCTCACGVLRGMAELGLSNVVAPSAFIAQVDSDVCIVCGECVERCPFGALALEDDLIVNAMRCVGCGVCTLACEEHALSLGQRPGPDFPTPPETEQEWRESRARARNISLDEVL